MLKVVIPAILLSMILFPACGSNEPMELYVAIDGNDEAEGSKDNPYAKFQVR